MSLQDAIQVFKDTPCYGTMDIAKSVILKVLEQQPCDDAISRQAAIDALRDVENHAFNSYYKGLVKAHKVIVGLPSVTPQYTEAEIQEIQKMEQAEIQKAYELGKAEQPKTGHWIYSGSYDVEGMLYCSNCKHKIDVSEGYFNFCPNCGAKMEVEECEG